MHIPQLLVGRDSQDIYKGWPPVELGTQGFCARPGCSLNKGKSSSGGRVTWRAIRPLNIISSINPARVECEEQAAEAVLDQPVETSGDWPVRDSGHPAEAVDDEPGNLDQPAMMGGDWSQGDLDQLTPVSGDLSEKDLDQLTSVSGDWSNADLDQPATAGSDCQECYKNSTLFAQFLSYPHNLWIVILFSSPLLC